MRFTVPTFNTLNTLALLVCVFLSGCATSSDKRLQPHQEVKIETAPVLAATGCIDQVGRPEDVVPLNERYPESQWTALAPGARAQAVRAQAGARLNYEDALEAATAGCK